MSVIGPRPLLVEYLPYYTKEEHHRHDVRPGLSGWAQINGRNAIDSYVISFCTSGDSLLMWSEYSDFMGYCMEFEYGKLKETFQEHCGNDCMLFDGKVIYDHDEQTELLEDLEVRVKKSEIPLRY